MEHGILAGVDLGETYPEMKNYLLVAVTEMNTREEIDALIDLLGEVAHD
jgi:glycine dehydrogenase subunit 1